jgi:hypothetical protein
MPISKKQKANNKNNDSFGACITMADQVSQALSLPCWVACKGPLLNVFGVLLFGRFFVHSCCMSDMI